MSHPNVDVSIEPAAPVAPLVAVVESPPSSDMLRLAEEAGQHREQNLQLQTEVASLRAQVSELTQRQTETERTAQAAAALAIAAVETTETEEDETETEVIPVEVPPVVVDPSAQPTASPARERGLVMRMFLGKSS